MRGFWFTAFAILCVSCFGLVSQQTMANETDQARIDGTDISFPNYSRQDIARTCLYSYGTENSSMVDCVAQDKDFQTSLSRRWANIDDGLKKFCLSRLEAQRLNSYSHLDRCLRTMPKDATPE